MSGKKEQKRTLTEILIKAGAAGILLSMILLLPGALLAYTGAICLENSHYITWMTACVGALLGQILYKRKGTERGVAVRILIAEGTYIGLLLLLSAGLPGGRMEWLSFYPIIIASCCGTTAGALIKINKTYKQNNRKQKGYTKSNRIKKFT